jgi:prepilin-type N-terminal cleavage/methylation domain-containing protein
MKIQSALSRTQIASKAARSPSGTRGFTLAEVAVTIVIVGIALVLSMQGLNGSKLQAAQTRNYKLARELATATLGEVGAGMWAADVTDGLQGSYADLGYPEFSYELVVGDDQLSEETTEYNRGFDSWKKDADEEEEEEEETSQPYEKVRIRVVFPKVQEYENSLTLEQWFAWDQVYGSAEEQEKAGIEGQTKQPSAAAAAGEAGAEPPSSAGAPR